MKLLSLRVVLPVLCFLPPLLANPAAADQNWPESTPTTRPWTRWWWPGSAVSEEGLTRQLEALQEAGIGGVEITPIYGARGWEERYVDFLSPRWVELLEWTLGEARRLDMQVDMATGTGWPFGGPQVKAEHAAKRLVGGGDSPTIELTGQRVKRAAPGGAGLVLDPFSAEAIRSYLDSFDRAFESLSGVGLRGQFHDSFEYYGANWTDALPARFESMHGYALEEALPALLGAGVEEIDADALGRMKGDYRRTLDVLHQEYLQAWKDWAGQRGWVTRNQSHGAPANLLDLYAIADIPETEVFGSTPFPIPGLRREPDAIRQGLDLPEPLVTRMAASAAHVMGKRLVSSETATWLRDHWKVTLAAAKPEIDRIFLDGINHVFYHGTVYSPPEAAWPGWLFYASTQFNPSNPWWRDFAALNAYVERVQRVLQGGRHGNDTLLYWPAQDIWDDAEGPLAKQLTVHHVDFVLESPFGRLARELKEAGYAFDYVSDQQVADLRVEGHSLVSPGGEYATLVVPPTRRMPLATLRSLLKLAHGGATIVFAAWPEDVPGWGLLAQRRTEWRQLLDQLPEERSVADGASLWRSGLGSGALLRGNPLAALARTSATREPMFSMGLECIRRERPEGTDYFIANLASQAFDGWAPLGVEAQSVVLLDPRDGRGGQAATRRAASGRLEVRLQLLPGETLVARALADRTADLPPWEYLVPGGGRRELPGPWKLVFARGGPALPGSAELPAPVSWTEVDDPETQRFAGSARYETRFELERVEEGVEWVLELGDVRDSARVHVNGQLAGVAWSLPFRVRVGTLLQSGENRLEIEVTNVAANRVRDLDRRKVDWKIMREINFVDINYQPFDASDWAIQPAGLVGPVRLVPHRVESR